MKPKKIYNLETTEKFMDAKIIGGNPNGIINFSRTPHTWALNIYTQMESNQWFNSECGLGQDKVPYKNLQASERYMYDMSLSQLITNDSVQVNQLMTNISQYITCPVTSAAISLQSYQEANHGKSYSVCVDEVCENVESIYELHKTEPMLKRKNNAVANMYSKIYNGNEPTSQDLLVAFAANQILEELVFPGGFVALWSLGNKLVGTAKMISFIQRDETATHVPLFRNIFNSSVKLVGITDETTNIILEMIEDMTNEEKIWTKHITKGNLGFSDLAIDMYIENQANSVCSNLKLPLLYKVTDGGPLMSIVNKYSMLSKTKIKANFFEVPVSDYAINSLDEDY